MDTGWTFALTSCSWCMTKKNGSVKTTCLMLDLWSQTGIYLLFGHAEGSISGIIATTADMLACGTSKKKNKSAEPAIVSPFIDKMLIG